MKHERDIRVLSSGCNAQTKATQQIHEVNSSARNWHIITEAIKSGRARDLSAEPKVPRTPAFILGSGPSLDAVLPLLKDWKGGIFCSTSHARTLVYHGAPPTHIMVLDPYCDLNSMKGVDWSKYGTKLITTPGAWPDLIEYWPNEMLLFRQYLGNRQTFYAQEQNQMYAERAMAGELTSPGGRETGWTPMIPSELTVFACSPPAEMFAAGTLGYGNIFLTGCDFAYSHGKARFTAWIPQEDGTWKEDARPFTDPMEAQAFGDPATTGNHLPEDFDSDACEVVMSDNGIPSMAIHLYYKKNLITAVRLGLQNVFDTDQGSITELKKADAAEVIRRQGKGYKRQTPKSIAKRTEPYLARVGAYVLEGPKGYTFVETENPLVDCRNYMIRLKRTYVCKVCGCTGVANDNADHNGEHCKLCPHGEIHQMNDIDVEKNMKRVIKLIPKPPSQVVATPANELSITKGIGG